MTSRIRPITPAVLTSAAALALTLYLSRSGDGPGLAVSLKHFSPHENGRIMAVLELRNPGEHTICLPDGFSVTARGDETRTERSVANLWLRSGKAVDVTIEPPPSAARWKAYVSYYEETRWNRAKMWLSGFSARHPALQRIPALYGLSSVRGREAASDWLDRTPAVLPPEASPDGRSESLRPILPPERTSSP